MCIRDSCEAIKTSLEKLSNEEVRVNVIHNAVGSVTESDIMLANASNAIIAVSYTHLNRIGSRVIKLTLLFAILVTGIFMIFHEDIGILVFDSAETGKMLLLLAPLIPMMYLCVVVD